jgi:hypothetical protein
MTPRKTAAKEPNPQSEDNYFDEPRTIPTGWDVSAFFNPERDNVDRYGSSSFGHPGAGETKQGEYDGA